MAKNRYCITYKAGCWLKQELTQKGEEDLYLSLFQKTQYGQDWVKSNGIVDIISTECPDYLCRTSDGKTIGLEVTNLVVPTKRYKVLVAIEQAARQACEHFKKYDDIDFHLIVDIWDENDCLLPYKPWYERLVRQLDAVSNKIRDGFIKAMSSEPIMDFEVVKKNVDAAGCSFVITYSLTDVMQWHVNSARVYFENPLNQLKKTLGKKDKKVTAYRKVCQKCCLLVVSDNSTASAIIFDDKKLKRSFISSFDSVFLLEIDGCGDTNLKITNLKIKRKNDAK